MRGKLTVQGTKYKSLIAVGIGRVAERNCCGTRTADRGFGHDAAVKIEDYVGNTSAEGKSGITTVIISYGEAGFIGPFLRIGKTGGIVFITPSI